MKIAGRTQSESEVRSRRTVARSSKLRTGWTRYVDDGGICAVSGARGISSGGPVVSMMQSTEPIVRNYPYCTYYAHAFRVRDGFRGKLSSVTDAAVSISVAD